MYCARWQFALVLLCGSTAAAQEIQPVNGRRQRAGEVCPIPCVPEVAPGTPGQPNANEPTPSTNPFNEALASAGEGGTQPAASYMPAFFGDLLGGFGIKPINKGAAGTRDAFAPINRHAGAIKITDNESPQPADRVFWFYDEFSYVNYSSNTNLAPINLQRQVFGFEKTLLGGWASIGMRLPVVITDGPPQVAVREFADMTIITKVALWDDKPRGRLISTGLAITVPTGQPEVFVNPTSRNAFSLSDVILQPYVGWTYARGSKFYLHGFTAIAVPTDSKDVTLLFNDVGVGYWLWRNDDDSFVRGVVPTMELHVNTPLNHRGKDAGTIGFSDVVDITWGVQFVLPRSTLGGAVGTPITGPRPYGVEAVARYELKF
jgi:hypothetical protein